MELLFPSQKTTMAEKKKMEEEHSDAVKLSGIPEDATDIDINKLHEPGEMLNENMPMERDEEPTLEELHSKTVAPQPHEESAPDPELDEMTKMKIRKMLGRMV